MIPWILLSAAKTPDTKKELKLYQRDTEYSIRVNGAELMNSRVFGSEKMLAELSCAEIAHNKNTRVLIGGLGMGYTLSAALASLNSDADVCVVELIPSVVTWNHDVLGTLADYPLLDSRVTVLVDDVVQVIKRNTSAFDAIVLDVDNGPDSLTQEGNDALYSRGGLSMIHHALRPGGVVAVWSASPAPGFAKTLKKSSFSVVEKKVRARAQNKGPVHTIWIAKKKMDSTSDLHIHTRRGN
jgi:spermidine synthase